METDVSLSVYIFFKDRARGLEPEMRTNKKLDTSRSCSMAETHHKTSRPQCIPKQSQLFGRTLPSFHLNESKEIYVYNIYMVYIYIYIYIYIYVNTYIYIYI